MNIKMKKLKKLVLKKMESDEIKVLMKKITAEPDSTKAEQVSRKLTAVFDLLNALDEVDYEIPSEDFKSAITKYFKETPNAWKLGYKGVNHMTSQKEEMAERRSRKLENKVDGKKREDGHGGGHGEVGEDGHGGGHG